MYQISLAGKSAFVTGSSQGIGECIARTLFAAGASVGINYFDDPDGSNRQKAERIADDLNSQSDTTAESDQHRAHVIPGDVRSLASMESAFQEFVSKSGGLDILVNNAGIIRDRTLKKMTEQEWQDVIDTNLTGVFHSCKAAVECLGEGGRIINISSLAAAAGFFGQVNYVAAKSGVMGITKVLSKELARRKILCNAIAPGVIDTEMGQSIPEENRKWMIQQVPLERFGEPVEIANVALFLSSDLSSYMTGQTLHVNGGWWAA